MKKIPGYIKIPGQAWLKKLFSEFQFDKSELELTYQAAGCLDRINSAGHSIEANGILIGPKLNPACNVERDNKILFSRLCRELGIIGPETEARLPRRK